MSALLCIGLHGIAPFVAFQAASLASPSSPQALALVYGTADQREWETAIRTNRATYINTPSPAPPIGVPDDEEYGRTSNYGEDCQSENMQDVHISGSPT